MDSKDFPMIRSPVSKLGDNILTFIFELNSRTMTLSYIPVNEERSLNLVRAASQVCRSWRTLLLDSPIIWGRLIDLDVLKGGKREWREEVFRRAQSSPLWVVGNVPESTGDPTDIRSYFVRLLQSWERVEKLVVVILGKDIAQDIQNSFLCPAPILKLFEVYLPDAEEPLFHSTLLLHSTQSLFGNYAPSLIEFHADLVAFQAHSPWLSNVRDIHIPSRISVPEILDLLLHTPLLETMFLSFSTETEDWNPVQSLSPRMNLPHLSVMYLTNTLATITTILDQVSPAEGCSLGIYTSDYSPTADHVLNSLKERLPVYISNYFGTYTSTSILFQLHHNKFRFEDVITSNARTFFEIKLYLGPDAAELIMCMLQAFAPSPTSSPFRFKVVIELDIDLRDVPISVMPNLYSMLIAFRSVRRLQTNEDSIYPISMLSQLGDKDYRDNRETPFPAIHTLQLRYLTDCASDGNKVDSLLHFLTRRKDTGLPVITLDLTSCNSYNMRDLSSLEKIDGLEVVWKLGNSRAAYICGSGEPERLRFTPQLLPV